jgi:hypothetical protein
MYLIIQQSSIIFDGPLSTTCAVQYYCRQQLYMVYNKSWNGSARSYLSSPCDYGNGTGAKSCLSSLSFLCGNLKMLIVKIMADIRKKYFFYVFLRCRRCVKLRLNIVKGKCKWLSVMARNLLISRNSKRKLPVTIQAINVQMLQMAS